MVADDVIAQCPTRVYTMGVANTTQRRLQYFRRERQEKVERQGEEIWPSEFLPDRSGERAVRDRIKALSPEDRKRIGEDVKTVEFGWPIGMPVCKPLGDGTMRVRSNLAQNRIARVLFYIDKRGRMVLLHAFIKKTQKDQDSGLGNGQEKQKQTSVRAQIRGHQ